MSGTTRSGPPARQGMDELPTAIDDDQIVRRLLRWLSKSDEWPAHKRQVFEIAHRRFSQTFERVTDEDRLIDAWVAFEALFLPKQEGELAYRAQMRIARFVGADLSDGN
jgi:hypothetical protein